MTIEFDVPQGEVEEKVINFLRNELMEIHNRDKEISRADVSFRKQPAGEGGDHICEIAITIYGNSLLVLRSAGAYDQAARNVIKEITVKVDEQISKQNDPPEEITSTVEV